MLILSHRGCWRVPAEKNSPAAFARSFHLGFGTETDVRDLAGRLVVAHDPPAADPLPADVLFGIYHGVGAGLPLALNVKADGLQGLLPPLLERYAVTNWFVFDMSVPDALGWLRIGAPTFTRHSDVEPHPPYYDRAAGIWLDAFHADWWDATTIRRHLDAGKTVCVVSPDLHGRDPRAMWDRLAAAADLRADPRVMLCTDRPEDARGVIRG
jgi:glycerophosphoryl diester phosphodiesterase